MKWFKTYGRAGEHGHNSKWRKEKEIRIDTYPQPASSTAEPEVSFSSEKMACLYECMTGEADSFSKYFTIKLECGLDALQST